MRSRTLIIVLWTLVILGSTATVAAMLRINDDLAVFLPRSMSAVESLLFDRLKHGPAARLVMIAFKGGTLEGRVAASHGAAAALDKNPQISRVLNGEQTMAPETFADLFAYRYLLTDAGPLDEAALRPAMEERARQLASPFGKMYAQEAALDPTGAFRELLVTWRDGVKPPRREDGVWVTEDGARSILLLETKQSALDLGVQAQLVAEVEGELVAIAAKHGVEVDLAGSPVTHVRARAQTNYEMTLGSIAGVVMVVSFLYWVYGSTRVLLLGTLPIATGLLVGTAAVCWGFGSVHRITLAFGTTLLGIAIDYPLHVFSHTRPGELLACSARRIAVPLSMGALTSIAAFAVLGTGGIAGLGQLAWFTASGLAAAALTALFVLPALAGKTLLFENAKAPIALDVQPPAWSGALFLGLIAAMVGAVILQGEDPWERDLGSLSPVPRSVQQLDGEIRAALDAPDQRFMFMAEAADKEGVLQLLEMLEPSLIDLRDSGAIKGHDSIIHYLPSMMTQKQRQMSLPEIEVLEDALAHASSDLSALTTDGFDPFLQTVADSKALAPLDLDQGLAMFRTTPLWTKLNMLVTEQDGRAYGFVPLSGVQDLDALAETASRHQGVSYVDLRQVSADSIVDLRDQALLRLLIGLAVVFALMFLVRRNLQVALRIVTALVCAVGLTAAMMLLSGERFSLLHILASLVVIGVGLDYGLFFSWNGDRLEERRRAFHGIFVCAVSTMIVFALLSLSSIAVLRVIGLTVALGTCLTFISSYLLVALPSWRKEGRV